VGVDETMVLVTRLPDDFTQTSFAIRSSLQDVRFYVDGELRSEYHTDKTRLNGKNSASRYVFCPTSEKDAGKMLQIELTTHTDNYSGVVNTVYCGDKGDIWASIFRDYGLETIIAFFLLFVGLVTIIFSVALGIAYHTRFDMEYLGWCILMGAAWMLGESKLRQLWIPNVSILSAVCFLVILLCPVSVLIYMDSVQKKRYTRMYHAIGYAAVADFVVCTLLHLAGVKDFIETLPVSQGILVITFLAVCTTFGIDFFRKRAGEYGLTLIGMLIAMMSVVVEVVSTYYVVVLSGIFTGIGMLVLLFANIVRTVQSVRDMEIQKKRIEKENYDHLTGLPMRSRGEAMIADLIMEQDGCLVFCDMDNLKKINDIYGHKAGDRALGCLGTLLKDVGEPSVACRLGGDEFLLFLPEATKDQAQERIKQLFAQFIEKKDEDVEMHDVYETYDAYVSASQSEGFGLTLMEAVGSGLPIIGFDVRYGNQTFIDDGENGYRIPIHDEMDQKEKIALLADRIVHMLTEDDMEAFSEHSYEKAQAFLTKEVVKRWISLLK
jgi:diguanylate cyclase (GGDEF)-like protein